MMFLFNKEHFIHLNYKMYWLLFFKKEDTLKFSPLQYWYWYRYESFMVHIEFKTYIHL